MIRPYPWRPESRRNAGIEAAARAVARWAVAGLTAGMLLAAVPAAAESVTVGGLTFSDELGGFRILEVSGAGRLDDPFIVVEEVTGDAPAILMIYGMSIDYGNLIGSHHLAGFALTKVVINRTATAWSRYEVELREMQDYHSPYGDGLSFGQGGEAGRPFLATGFAGNREIDEPYDSVVFDSGLIRPGEAATFSLVVTDTTPASPIYVVQAPMQEVADQPGATQLASTQMKPR